MNQEHKILYHTLQAQWWMHSATNGHCQKRKIYHGTQGPEFTPDEKRDDVMETASRHMEMIAAIADDLELSAKRKNLILL